MARTDRKPRQRLDPDARRAAILAAATEAFAAQPYADVKVSAVAAQAGASDALLYRYFAGKEELYAAVVRAGVDALGSALVAALAELDDGVPVRERLRAAVIVYLDHIAARPGAWAMPHRQPGGEPPAAAALRAAARTAYVDRLRALLAPSAQARHEYALWGYYGFLDAVCLRWVERGCPADDRWSVIDAALGALEGALGDWAA
ncbi:TetR/AcrR family transcriptional regulator [Xylanimonas protaetiae]|uniref:TetR/AcrR family transcriptional regulator n=1 Tax=Xylanimonas protaetiae TaxID=2509457 RepID=A0A4P6F3I0_9MICO|nr:TetR/AcrR family transcriptional regulator [Xylanimonas protaetiae]QAY68739.1 TetR/AcrR family transcriptional regulator [Xylanimonas protaetiae]